MYSIYKPVERPVWKNHELVGHVTLTWVDADRLNREEGASVYYGYSEEERRILREGSILEVRESGLLGCC